MRYLLLSVAIVLVAPITASADVITPTPPQTCPEGSASTQCHNGRFCYVPNECNPTACPGTCVPQMICVGGFACGGSTGFVDGGQRLTEHHLGSCATAGESCGGGNGVCQARSVCMVDAGTPPPADMGADPGDAGAGVDAGPSVTPPTMEDEGCAIGATSERGSIVVALAALVFVALAFVPRRKR